LQRSRAARWYPERSSRAGVESENAAVIEYGPSTLAPPPVMITDNLPLTVSLLKDLPSKVRRRVNSMTSARTAICPNVLNALRVRLLATNTRSLRIWVFIDLSNILTIHTSESGSAVGTARSDLRTLTSIDYLQNRVYQSSRSTVEPHALLTKDDP
jgi:hypothetical protein